MFSFVRISRDVDMDEESMDVINDGSKAFSCIFLLEWNTESLKLAGLTFFVRALVVCSGAKEKAFSAERLMRMSDKIKEDFNIYLYEFNRQALAQIRFLY